MTVTRDLSDVPRRVWRHPHATRAEIDEYQSWRLRHLVTHAYERVPYYRRLFDRHGLTPGAIRSPADLCHIPITSKRDLQLLPPREVVARGYDPERLIESESSGSTGEPFIVRRTWFEQNLLHLFRIRADRALNIRFRDRKTELGLIRSPNPRDNKLIGRGLQALGLFRTRLVDTFLASEEIIAHLRRLPPDVLTGYPNELMRVADALDEDDRRNLQLRMVLSGAEVMTPRMRQRISTQFDAPVYDRYGSMEFNLLAWECPHSGEYHTCDDAVILEVLKDGRPARPGEQGEVVVTNLHAYAMPFIRYRLGDVVIRGSNACACGQPFETLREIQGRMVDHFVLPDGRTIHPYEITWTHVEKEAPWIRQLQIVQERTDRIVLRLVPSGTPVSENLAKMRALITDFLGPGVEFEILLVPEIPREPSGKVRECRSLVQSAYEDGARTDGIPFEGRAATGATK